ncbi:hypothetical protein BHE74_00044989 [Ensete ventricosum]|nr:hypothetical protein BHE74_00044989 [Ensete ventricosum]
MKPASATTVVVPPTTMRSHEFSQHYETQQSREFEQERSEDQLAHQSHKSSTVLGIRPSISSREKSDGCSSIIVDILFLSFRPSEIVLGLRAVSHAINCRDSSWGTVRSRTPSMPPFS